ncbi:heme NO-binding domain-containing protein [Vibrio sp. CAU 1672]|uniref:heme NO-binding domain-containing protein n=1 Tax=Vibrio sp. CAU 1672 TaxID=3032594 RepID=UPI0023DC17DD|nr:heme NO-binding domain-containing protein [Vibrio sp. CAU 1672]MDF2154331.1 heme NO-binding domain-containing protein [Vibrio sp. CAU 1672]
MKGIIFTEFMELVENKFGLEVLDEVLDLSGNRGVYTAVGSYDHRELVKLIVNLSKVTGVAPEALQQVFGECVFHNLLRSVPSHASLQQCSSAFQFIRHVEDFIHVEVKKLYPDANPPRFDFISETVSELVFDYRSARCMAHVCLGLIKGCASHFGEEISVKQQQLSDDGSQVRFWLQAN